MIRMLERQSIGELAALQKILQSILKSRIKKEEIRALKNFAVGDDVTFYAASRKRDVVIKIVRMTKTKIKGAEFNQRGLYPAVVANWTVSPIICRKVEKEDENNGNQESR